MNATMSLENIDHFPVMLDQILSIITPQHGGTFIDCTFGAGGYSKAILKYPNTKVIAFDRDKSVKYFSKALEKECKGKFKFYNEKFSILSLLVKRDIHIKAIIFDLGFSLMQVKNLDRGFSFESKSPLDMRMGINKFSAHDVLNKLNQNQISTILKYFGDEKDHKKIAFHLIKLRKNKNVLNTDDLVRIIKKIKKNNNFIKKNVATKSLQAIRIFVNNEVSELIKGLIEATKLLNPGGILIVVSFHSLEDKIVKYFFRTYSEKNKNPSRYSPKLVKEDIRLFDCPIKKSTSPSEKEILINPSSRSAKLRYGIRNDKKYFFPKELIEKFRNYLDIEKMGQHL
jgi:16S rRNA (cytosine1402-N4)-methyltransferase